MEQTKLLICNENGRIIDNIGAPPLIIMLFDKALRESSLLKEVILDAGIKEIEEANMIGCFDPQEKRIVIDLGMCIKVRSWMEKAGTLLITNVILNLLFASLHELSHVQQLEEEPELIEFDTLPQEYEDEANEMAFQTLQDVIEGMTIPSLDELGYIGQRLKRLYNNLYATMPNVVLQELSVIGTNLGGLAEDVARKSKTCETLEDISRLLKTVDDGEIGGKINGVQYLTIADILALIEVDKHESAKEREAENG